jgi:hypothetical protein
MMMHGLCQLYLSKLRAETISACGEVLVVHVSQELGGDR